MVELNKKKKKKNKVSKKQIKKLHKTYDKIEALIEYAREVLDGNILDNNMAHKIQDKLTKLEFKLQKHWNFPQDKNYHKYWLELPGCKCPYFDNEEMLGTKYSYKSEECPYHCFECDKSENIEPEIQTFQFNIIRDIKESYSAYQEGISEEDAKSKLFDRLKDSDISEIGEFHYRRSVLNFEDLKA